MCKCGGKFSDFASMWHSLYVYTHGGRPLPALFSLHTNAFAYDLPANALTIHRKTLWFIVCMQMENICSNFRTSKKKHECTRMSASACRRRNVNEKTYFTILQNAIGHWWLNAPIYIFGRRAPRVFDVRQYVFISTISLLRVLTPELLHTIRSRPHSFTFCLWSMCSNRTSKFEYRIWYFLPIQIQFATHVRKSNLIPSRNWYVSAYTCSNEIIRKLRGSKNF